MLSIQSIHIWTDDRHWSVHYNRKERKMTGLYRVTDYLLENIFYKLPWLVNLMLFAVSATLVGACSYEAILFFTENVPAARTIGIAAGVSFALFVLYLLVFYDENDDFHPMDD